MSVSRCPSCSTQVMPGDMACRRCGFDFILGRKPEDWNPIDATRRRRTQLVSLAAAALIIGGIVVLVLLAPAGEAPDPADSDPCLVALKAMQPAVVAAVGRGNPIPTCGATPPGPDACWASVDVSPSQHAGSGVEFTLRGGSSGFDLQCLVDADGDGTKAVYKANAVIDGVKISSSDTR